jgi:hypothetical protein
MYKCVSKNGGWMLYFGYYSHSIWNKIINRGKIILTTREEEMAKLRDRYARQMKSNVSVEKKLQPQEEPIVKLKEKKHRLNFKPYFFLIENDIRRLFRLPQKEWKVGGLKFEQTNKPLNLEWLKNNNGKIWK